MGETGHVTDFCHRWVDTSIGRLLVVASQAGLRAITFERNGRPADPPERSHPVGGGALDEAARQLADYFKRRRRRFDLPLDPAGTPFQRRVWEALRKIPYGETRSYGEIAREIGRPDAMRAVGAANGANPLPIVVPCHRVVGADGSLTGFGGGLDVKRFLLELEGAIRQPPLFFLR
jgi:methylated-DNA-[protein]-cysteine S-methyltransferase